MEVEVPYIPQEQREELEWGVRCLLVAIRTDGELNFIITKLLLGYYDENYINFERAVGLLECVKQELYRRKIAPYEDEKCEQSGDVY